MGQIWSSFRQAYPPSPSFTEKDYPDLTGKIAIVTGSNTGVGKQTARLLYLKNAHVFVAARNKSKATSAITDIKSAHPDSKGSLHFLSLDLGDLTTIKSSAQNFLDTSKSLAPDEGRLDLLINNAGVMMPDFGTKTAQGYELQLGTNCLGHFLFTKFLTPTLAATAAKEKAAGRQDTVRVVWVASSAVDLMSPKGGVPMDDLDWDGEKMAKNKDTFTNRGELYGVSKAGNFYHATEFARRFMKDGIISIPINPGNLQSDLQRHVDQQLLFKLLSKVSLHPPVNGAYTENFAAMSPEITLAKSGSWVVPWGRFATPRADIIAGSRSKEEGGTGMAERFWEWSEEQVKKYL